MAKNVKEYIESHWDECIKVNKEDSGELIGLPYPYTVPAVGHFDELYYWDTYFLNQGLKLCGRHEQVKFNTDNLLYMLDKFGFVPNGNRTYYLKNSQPPFLSAMVRDVYEHYNDKTWLEKAYTSLEKEYEFWMEKRISPIGLNQYSPVCPPEDVEVVAEIFRRRVGYTPDISDEEMASKCLILGESGWDFTPRFGLECEDFVQVDLNSLMYMLEKNMEFFSAELGNSDGCLWRERAEKRSGLMNRYMKDENNLFFDYNYKTGEFSKIYSVASYYPMYVGMADSEQALAAVDNLPRLEEKYGIVTCEKNSVKGRFQWNYPNGWACLQYIMTEALKKYGYMEKARDIAKKYIELVDKVFEETGNIWEKYNVVEGSIDVVAAGKMPAMMGWTAGAYLALKEFS